jgi:hypothetical protein
MHPLRSARENGRVVAVRVSVPDAAFEDEANRRETAMRVPAHARTARKVLRRRVVQQHKWVEVAKLLRWKRLPDGKRAHRVGLGKNHVRDGSKTHGLGTRSRT